MYRVIRQAQKPVSYYAKITNVGRLLRTAHEPPTSQPTSPDRARSAIPTPISPIALKDTKMTPFKYTGFDLDLSRLEEECYPIGFPEAWGGEFKVLQLREVAMMMLMDQITDKPNWHEKVFDEAIVQKWRQEAAEQPERGLIARIIEEIVIEEKEYDSIPQPPKIATGQAFEYCIKELRNKAKSVRDTGLVQALDSSRCCVVKSDTLFSEDLRRCRVPAQAHGGARPGTKGP